ncbi:coenzyme F420-0:L-glutamate ligase [Actinoplanes sp. NPDC051470]|uniref:coenzyme F420-0:L-glutamate ligase n=1 Tax=Actinoplanes sp. NPDC051470 TaxID=3157224 RepID=UPI00342C4D12
MDGLEVLPVRGIGDIAAGDDLADIIVEAAPWLADGDVLVVTSKIVSKAEGRLVEVPSDGPERDEARARMLAAETAEVVARRGTITIVRTHHGFTMLGAGIDASNVDKARLVLLPLSPDASAAALRKAFRAKGLNVGVIVSDTSGRPWRIGLTDLALGSAGVRPLRDHRGEVDPYGNELRFARMAVVDELAAAAELVKGKRDQVPVAVIRGFPAGDLGEYEGVSALLRDPADDMFSMGVADTLRGAARMADAAPAVIVDAAAVLRALDTVGGHLDAGTRVRVELLESRLILTTETPTPDAFIRLGIDVHRLRVALAAEKVGSRLKLRDHSLILEL